MSIIYICDDCGTEIDGDACLEHPDSTISSVIEPSNGDETRTNIQKHISPRGFQVCSIVGIDGNAFDIAQSSAIDQEYKRGMELPGSSFLWLRSHDDSVHLNRKQVSDLKAVLEHWLSSGLLFDHE